MYRNILVGTDGSATANEAVTVAIGVAAPLGARLHLVSVSDDPASAAEVFAAPVAQAQPPGCR